MKHSPQFIIWWSISRYLTPEEIIMHKVSMAKLNPMGNTKFINYIKKNFDIERLRTEPVVWQDIWVYNYLTIDKKSKISRNPLLTNYEKIIMLPEFR
jgi:hypothetical protein